MSMRREEEHSWLARVFKCSDGRENAIGREEDIVKIKKMILRDTPDPIFVVGAKYVGKTQLARHLYKHWKEEEKTIVPVLFSFIGDFASFDDRSLLEQFSVKVILDCQTKDCGTASAQKGNAPSLIEQAVDAAKVMRKQKRRVVILIDDWLAILDRCRELDKRAFADFLNIGLTKLKDAGATFVFLDRFPCRVLPEEILEKLPAVRDPYYLLPLAYNAVVAVAKKKKYKIDQAGEALWNYVGGNIDLVKRLCDHWKGANAICDNEREKIHNVMDELVRSLARLFVKTKEEAVKLLQRLAENPETVVNDQVVKELCRMGVVDSSGGGPWMCGAMREYLFSCNGEGARENKKPMVLFDGKSARLQVNGSPIEIKDKWALLILYLIAQDPKWRERDKIVCNAILLGLSSIRDDKDRMNIMRNDCPHAYNEIDVIHERTSLDEMIDISTDLGHRLIGGVKKGRKYIREKVEPEVSKRLRLSGGFYFLPKGGSSDGGKNKGRKTIEANWFMHVDFRIKPPDASTL